MIAILMFAAASVAHCHPVEGDRIRGSDLAAAAPALSALPADLTVGFAPQPGARRLFEAFELARIAQVNGLTGTGSFEPVCFERAVAALDPVAVQAAMLRALDTPDAHIEIVELSKFPVPAGEIIFPRTTLNEPVAADSTIWSGYVSYDGGRSPIWARVRIAVHQKRVVAAALLRPGHPVQESDVTIQEVDEFPRATAPLASIDRAIGRIPRRLIPAGAPLMASALDEPNDVEAGQTVLVEVRSGAATVTVEAKAEAAGRRGDILSFRNPVSGKVFRARVEDKGRALIDCPHLDIAQ